MWHSYGAMLQCKTRQIIIYMRSSCLINEICHNHTCFEVSNVFFFVIPIRITPKQTATSLFLSTWKLHGFRLGCRKWIHDYVLIQFDIAHWIYANISFIFENANTNNRSLDCWFFLFVTISSFKWSRFIRADYVWYCSEFDMISFTNPS